MGTIKKLLTVKWFDGEQVPDTADKIECRDGSHPEDSDIDYSDEESESDIINLLIILNH